MRDITIKTVIACDDARREDNGKEILIGVYTSDIVVTGFPVNMALCFWIRGFTENSGDFYFDFRVLGPHENQLFQGSVTFTVPMAGLTWSMRLGPMPMQIQSEGELRLEVREADEEWHAIERLPIVRRGMASQPG